MANVNLNIPEILVANGAGIVMVAFLFLFRIKQKHSHQVHDQIFSVMLVSILLALIGETTSFCIDGREFTGCCFLQYLMNVICLSQTAVVAFLWCLFVDYRIYYSRKRLKKKAVILSVPLIVFLAMLLGDLFGAGLIFEIIAGNVYVRGKLCGMTYIVVLILFVESIINSCTAQRKGVVPFLFPVYWFTIPSMVGMALQGCFYGISVGWLSASIAAVFIYTELQTFNSYIDTTSGLYNRKYINYYLSQTIYNGNNLHGILLDINDFKDINDEYGHIIGDRAIRAMGKILSQAAFSNAIALRMAGDEFVVFLSESSDSECQAQINAIYSNIEKFNKNTSEPFELSVSMGSGYFDGQNKEAFFDQMDATMYEVKRQYHKQIKIINHKPKYR